MKSRILEIGVKIDIAAGVQFFGADDVNALISNGWRVTSLRPGGVIFKKIAMTGDAIKPDNTKAVLSGFDMKIELERDR